MAVDRLTSPLPGAAAPQPQPSRAVREAQAAFFRAALGQVQAAQAPEPRPAIAPAPRTAQVAQAAPAQADAEPKPSYRPGSLLDVRI